MGKVIKIVFSSPDRGEWIKTIHESMRDVGPAEAGDVVDLVFSEIETDDLEPVHLVTLACLIEFFDKKGYWVCLINPEAPIGKFMLETLQFSKYWQEKQNYVPVDGNVDAIFNLWRFVEDEKEAYSQQIHDYLQRRFFKKKDLSAVKNSLLEVYYNVSDHAEADGNAFSFIRFNETTGKLYVAVCDFGKGIARTVRGKFSDIRSDATALEKAMTDRFTVESREHNMGMGLGSIRRTCKDQDILRILSNKGFLYANSDFIHVRESNIILNGTLIYYELSLSHFDDLEILPNFEL